MRPAFFIAVILVGLCSASPAIANGFSDWAAIGVAGDWHADSGAPSPVFDNARRDIAGELDLGGLDGFVGIGALLPMVGQGEDGDVLRVLGGDGQAHGINQLRRAEGHPHRSESADDRGG